MKVCNAVMALVACGAMSGAAEINWVARNPELASRPFSKIVWTGRQFVALGPNLVAAHSSNGRDWIRADSYKVGYFNDGAANENADAPRVLAIDAPNRVLMSEDADKWSDLGQFPAVDFLYSVFWTGKGFLFDAMVSGGDSIIFSSGPDSWMVKSLPGIGRITGVANGGGAVVVTGSTGVYTSADGLDWSAVTGLEGGASAVTFKDSLFVAIQPGGGIYSSRDGKSWGLRKDWMVGLIEQVDGSDTLWGQFDRIHQVDSELVLIGAGRAFRSKDFVDWTPDSLVRKLRDSLGALPTLSSAKQTLFAFGDGGGIARLDRFQEWIQTVRSETNSNLLAVAHGNGTWLAVGDHGTILSSKDGKVWKQEAPISGEDLRKVVWGGKMFRVITGSGKVLSSSDGSSWGATEIAIGVELLDILWQDSLKVVLGAGGMVYRSRDGKTWDSATLPDGGWVDLIASSGSSIVLAGASGDVFTSLDAMTWERVAGGAGASVVLGWTGSKFVKSGGFNLQTSVDGNRWNQHIHSDFWFWPKWRGIVVGNREAYLFTSEGGIARIESDTDFVQVGRPSGSMNALAITDSLWVSVGQGGVVMTSDGDQAVGTRRRNSERRFSASLTGRTLRIHLEQFGRVDVRFVGFNGRNNASLLSRDLPAGEYNVAIPEASRLGLLKVDAQGVRKSFVVLR